MVFKVFLCFLFSLFFNQYSYSKVVYERDNLVITEIDINSYQNLYKENYNIDINKTNSLKDLVLINNVINNLEINNAEFINKIDSEILLRFDKKSFENEVTRNFLRFSRIRDEFIINYFQNKLTLNEVNNIFKDLDNLNLPISVDDCIIIKDVLDLKDNKDFIENFYNNLKNNTNEFQIIINEDKYKVCINELAYKNIEKLIVEYIRIKTAEEFETFVYDKTSN
tara:strand:- start:78 stop:749 length:672 start_codon:yes stop_codon:yes gene_type:complete